MLELYIRNPAFVNIINGTKKYELRLLKGIFNNINTGDKILICNNNDKIKKTINKIIRFDNFNDLLKNLGVRNCLVRFNSVDEGTNYLKTIYNSNLQKKYSCIAIEFI